MRSVVVALVLVAGCGRIAFDRDGDGGSDGSGVLGPPPTFDLALGCSQLKLAGHASCLGGVVNTNNMMSNGTQGGAYLDHQVSLRAGLHVALELRITATQGRADGAAFVIHADPDGTLALGGGAALGISGIVPSIAVEVDTYDDVATMTRPDPDPDDNHLGYDRDGEIVSFATQPSAFDLVGPSFFLWIDYDPDTRRLDAFASRTPTKPTGRELSAVLPDAWLDNLVWIGMVGGAGPGSIEQHEIRAWRMTDSSGAP